MMIKQLLGHRGKRRRCYQSYSYFYPFLLFLVVVVVVVVDARSYSCSRCSSQSTSPPFSLGDPVECTPSDNTIGEFDDYQPFTQPNGDTCTCAITMEDKPYPYSCTLDSDNEICACDYVIPADFCPPGKCDYAFQCGTTLYVCWNLMDPTNLGFVENENDYTCENLEITSIVFYLDYYDNNLDLGGFSPRPLCSPEFLAMVDADDPNNSNIIGTTVCPFPNNAEVVKRYTKFCAPDNSGLSGGPPSGQTFDQCEGFLANENNNECLVPYCEYDNGDFIVTQYSQLPSTSITCPSDMAVTIPADDPTQCVQTVTHSDVTSDTDSCNFGISLSTGLSNGSEFPVGSTTNTYTATTSDGTVVSCSFVITVLDSINPTITCPTDITITAEDGAISAIVDYTIEVSDNCGGGAPSSNNPSPGDVNIFSADTSPPLILPQQTTGLPSGSAFPNGATTTNTFVVTDVSGNTNACSFQVTVVPATPSSTPSTLPSSSPSITPSLSTEPSTIPSNEPSRSMEPSSLPSSPPSLSTKPSTLPSDEPSRSVQPSRLPSSSPSLSIEPSPKPSTSMEPSSLPSSPPSLSIVPSSQPSTSRLCSGETPCALLFGQEGTPMMRHVRIFWFWNICVEECVLLDSVVELNLDQRGYECGYCS